MVDIKKLAEVAMTNAMGNVAQDIAKATPALPAQPQVKPEPEPPKPLVEPAQPQLPKPKAPVTPGLLDKAWDSVKELARPAAESVAQSEVDKVVKATPGTPDAPGASGWTDWLTDNWQTLLVPAGLIAVAFGGNTMKALGALAAAGGAYNLYERYSRLTDSSNRYNPLVSQAIYAAAQQTDENGNPAPFSDLDAAAKQAAEKFGAPEAADIAKYSLRDYTFLASHGFKDRISQQMQELPKQLADQALRGQLPATALPERAEPTNWLDKGIRTVDEFLVPGGKG